MTKFSTIIFLVLIISSSSYCGTEYIIKKKDDLEIISKKFYNTYYCWKEIYLANRKLISNPVKLIHGQKIFIPDRSFCFRPLPFKDKKALLRKIKKYQNSPPSTPITSNSKELIPSPPSIESEEITKEIIPRIDFEEKQKKFWEISLQVNPIKYRRINKEKDISYSANLTYNKDLYELYLNAERSAFSSSDELTGITVSADNRNALMTFDINKFFGNFTYFNLLYYNQEKSGEIYTTKHKIRTGPMGVKFDIIEDKKIIDEFSISFIPLFEYIIENVEEVGELGEDLDYIETKTKNLRASFRIRWKLKYKDIFKFKLTTFYRPAYPLDHNPYNSKDIAFENKAKITYLVGNYMSVGYINTFSYDVRKKLIHHLPSSDMEHTYLAEITYNF